MPKRLLDILGEKQQAAYFRKQEAYQRFKKANDHARQAHEKKQLAWMDKKIARDNMNQEYKTLEAANEVYQEVRNKYVTFRDAKRLEIDTLRSEADFEHQQMKDCFDRASEEYLHGDRSKAPLFSAEGREHKRKRDSLNAKVEATIQTIRDAKKDAESRTPKVDSSAYREAKLLFKEATAKHKKAEEEFSQIKAERDLLRKEFDAAQAEFNQVDAEWNEELKRVRDTKYHERALKKALDHKHDS